MNKVFKSVLCNYSKCKYSKNARGTVHFKTKTNANIKPLNEKAGKRTTTIKQQKEMITDPPRTGKEFHLVPPIVQYESSSVNFFFPPGS